MSESTPSAIQAGSDATRGDTGKLAEASAILDEQSIGAYETDAEACWVQDVHLSRVIWANSAAI